MPKISLVVAIYGVEKYIEQFLESIRAQTFNDFEAVLIDDGSMDRCPVILDEYAKKDKRFKVIHQDNGGASAARNTGLLHAEGEYVYIVDADDWLEETALENLWDAAKRTKADFICGDYYIDRRNNTEKICIFKDDFCTDKREDIVTLHFALNTGGSGVRCKNKRFKVIQGFGGAPWYAMVRRKILVNYNIKFDTELRSLGEDILFMQHVLDQTESVAYIQKPIYHYRMREESLSHGFKENLLDIYQIIFQKEEQYLSQSQKDSEYWRYYYFRIVRYINQSMNYYFQNKDYNISEKKRFQEFCMLMDQEPYRTAVKEVPLNIIVQKKTKVAVLLLRYKVYLAYWFLYKIKKYNFGSKERGKAK